VPDKIVVEYPSLYVGLAEHTERLETLIHEVRAPERSALSNLCAPTLGMETEAASVTGGEEEGEGDNESMEGNEEGAEPPGTSLLGGKEFLEDLRAFERADVETLLAFITASEKDDN